MKGRKVTLGNNLPSYQSIVLSKKFSISFKLFTNRFQRCPFLPAGR
jgi:hypothetical protein